MYTTTCRKVGTSLRKRRRETETVKVAELREFGLGPASTTRV